MADEKPIRISSSSHRIDVVIEQRSDVECEGRADLTDNGNSWTISDVRGALTVRVPLGSDLVIGSASGRVDVKGPAGNVAVVTDSGRIKVEHAAAADVRTTSGRIHIGQCDDECRVRSVSGRVRVDRCSGADVSTTNARITLDHVDGPVRAHAISGRIEIELEGPHDVQAETVSGRVVVSLPNGTLMHRTEGPGEVIEKPEDCDCVVQARSVSGRVDVSTR